MVTVYSYLPATWWHNFTHAILFCLRLYALYVQYRVTELLVWRIVCGTLYDSSCIISLRKTFSFDANFTWIITSWKINLSVSEIQITFWYKWYSPPDVLYMKVLNQSEIVTGLTSNCSSIINVHNVKLQLHVLLWYHYISRWFNFPIFLTKGCERNQSLAKINNII
jgi:hypothetical protein